MNDIAPIGKIFSKLTNRIDQEETNILIDVSRTKNNSVSELDSITKFKTISKMDSDLMGIQVFPNFDAFFTNIEKVYDDMLKEDFEAAKRIGLEDGNKPKTHEENFNQKVKELQIEYCNKDAKAYLDREKIKIAAAQSYNVIKDNHGRITKIILKNEYRGDVETIGLLKPKFKKERANFIAKKYTDDSSKTADAILELKNNEEKIKNAFNDPKSKLINTFEVTDDYKKIFNQINELNGKNSSEFFKKLDEVLSPDDVQEGQIAIDKYYEPAVKLVIDGSVPKDENPDDYEELLVDEHFEEISMEEYKNLITQGMNDREKINELKKQGIEVDQIIGGDVEDNIRQPKARTEEILNLAKVVESAKLYSQISKTHSGRFFSMIFHPINYYNEGKALTALRENLKEHGIDEATLDKLQKGEAVTNNEIIAKYVENEELKLTEIKNKTLTMQQDRRKQIMKKRGNLNLGEIVEDIENENAKDEDDLDIIEQENKSKIKEDDKDMDYDLNEIKQENKSEINEEINEEIKEEVKVVKENNKSQDIVEYLKDWRRQRQEESNKPYVYKTGKEINMERDAEELKDVELSEEEQKELENISESDAELWGLLEESLKNTKENIVKRSKVIDNYLAKENDKEQKVKDNIKKQLREFKQSN